MAYIRVPFFGSLLVEADDAMFADVPSGMWTASMKQATHNASMQAIPREIRAVDFCVERSKIEEISESLKKSMEGDAESAKEHAGCRALAETFGQALSELQTAWERHEFAAMRPDSEREWEKKNYPAI